jgi:hypothetical protein
MPIQEIQMNTWGFSFVRHDVLLHMASCSGSQRVVGEPLGSLQTFQGGSRENSSNGVFLCSQFDTAIKNVVSFATVLVTEKKILQFTVL